MHTHTDSTVAQGSAGGWLQEPLFSAMASSAKVWLLHTGQQHGHPAGAWQVTGAVPLSASSERVSAVLGSAEAGLQGESVVTHSCAYVYYTVVHTC